MRHVALVLADPRLAQSAAGASADAARLPALEYWVARAAALPLQSDDWRPWLAENAAVRPQDLLQDGVSGDRYWLATPVHWVAGLDTVRLHPEGLVSLTSEEQQQLVADFALVFASSGWQLLATGRRELLVCGAALDALTDDPANWLGRSPRDGMPRGPGAPALRNFGAEIEMWLHDHPVNRARAAAGQLPVNALWLWGGGGLAPVPERWSAMQDTTAAHAMRLVVLQGAQEASLDLARIERDWLQPALAAWRSGQVASLTLLAFGRQYSLRRAARWRFWRRARPWREGLPC
jgi:hypothetical protein